MIPPPERSAARDAAILALLPNVPFDGWTWRALRTGLVAAGGDERDAEILFPGGPPDMIEAFCDLADRRMEAGAAQLSLGDMRTPARVRAVLELRLIQNRPYREAIRRALAALALPRRAQLAARCTARTVDAIWHAAGDRSADFSCTPSVQSLSGCIRRRADWLVTPAKTMRRHWPSWTGGWRRSGGSLGCAGA